MNAGCPSEAILDAFELGEPLDAAIHTHVRSCEACLARLAERKTAFDRLDKPAMVSAIHRGVTAPRRLRLIGAISLAAAAAVAIFALLLPGRPAADRLKGSIGLSVFLERGGVIARASSATKFQPGDRLRFEVDLPENAHVLIVGVEADGRLYNTYPATEAIAPAQRMEKGVDQVLPGAVELDEKPGREVLHLVACDRPFDSSQIKQEGARLIVPDGCIETPFVLDKVN